MICVRKREGGRGEDLTKVAGQDVGRETCAWAGKYVGSCLVNAIMFPDRKEWGLVASIHSPQAMKLGSSTSGTKHCSGKDKDEVCGGVAWC